MTGPIGCGKSTVAGWLGERPGVVVIDADQVARDVLDPGEPALEAVVARFGRGLLRADGSLDRAALGRDRLRRPGRACATSRRSSTRRSGRGSWPRSRRRTPPAPSAVVIEAIKLVEGGLAAAVRRGLAGDLRPERPAVAADRARLVPGRCRPADRRTGRPRGAASRGRHPDDRHVRRGAEATRGLASSALAGGAGSDGTT